MKRLAPPVGKPTYKTGDGLEFWMDYQKHGPPFAAPTIRTTNPEIKVVFVPTAMHADDAYLMQHYETSIVFSRPGGMSIMHSNKIDRIKEENPGVDLIFDGIGEQVEWVEYIPGSPDSLIHKVPSAKSFKNLQEQEFMTTLFCELMAWSAYGELAMSNGGLRNGKIKLERAIAGFARNLLERMSAGVLLKPTQN